MQTLTLEKFYTELAKDPDLRRLGPYKLEGEVHGLVFPVDFNDGDGVEINLGAGDFSSKFAAFCNTKVKSINFQHCKFADLYLDNLEAEQVDFSNVRANRIYFDYAKIVENCRLGLLESDEIYFDKATIKTIFGNGSKAGNVHMDDLVAETFHVNTMEAGLIDFSQSTIGSLFVSRGSGIKKMDFARSKIELMNLHEAKIDEIRFGRSEIQRALLNKASIGIVDCEDAEINYLHIDQYENYIGDMNLSRANIGELAIKKGPVERLYAGVEGDSLYKSLGEQIEDPNQEYIIIKNIKSGGLVDTENQKELRPPEIKMR